MKLRELLHLRNGENIHEIFDLLAKELLLNYHIQKGTECYDILEIEFYYYSSVHPDIMTYPRTAQAGNWYFHPSGVDLAFESRSQYREGKSNRQKVGENDSFGGLLIRSIQQQDGTLFTGPGNCVSVLFDQFDALEMPAVLPRIVAREKKENTDGLPGISRCRRWIPPFMEAGKEDKKRKRYALIAQRYRDTPDDYESDACFHRFLHLPYCYYVNRMKTMNLPSYPPNPARRVSQAVE